MLRQLWNKIAGQPKRKTVSELTIEEMEAIKLDDIPFKYDQTRIYLGVYGVPVETLSDLLYGWGINVVLQDFFLRNPKYLVDIEDTMNREYGCSMFAHIDGFNFGYRDYVKPCGFCLMVRDIIERYRDGIPYPLMPKERLDLCREVWSGEAELDDIYGARKYLLSRSIPMDALTDDDLIKIEIHVPTMEEIKEVEAKLVEAIHKVEAWDKEHDYDNFGLLYAC